LDPEISQLARALEELTRRVDRLEQIFVQRPLRSDRPFVVPTPPVRASLESRVGSQYLNRAGIIALLVGIAFFLNWALVNNWIGPLAVVSVGLIAGVALFIAGEWFLRRSYNIVGFSLQGLGIAALYLTIWAASEYYRILLPWAGFAGMVLLTAATALAATLRNSEALAIFAAIGGFGTPLLLSTGRNLETELFIYVLILCAGMLVTIRWRPWVGLLITSFLGALTVSAVWFANYYSKTEQTTAFVFFCLVFCAFATAPILAQRALDPRRMQILVFVLPAAALVFLIGCGGILDADEFTWTAQIMAVALAIASWRWCRERLRASYFVTALAGSAGSIPVACDGHWTTSLIWLVYGILLIMFGFARKLPLVRWSALVLLGVTILKVFIYDLSNLGQGYRILALSILGIALLSLSFLYQRDWLGIRKP
jgi:uncharacterized membrane protein